MRITVNGAPRDLQEGASVMDAVTRFGPERHDTGVAVALNGEVVPKARWSEQELTEDDHVEVLVAIGGG